MDSPNNEIIGLIPDWLALTREADIPLGLSREEAFKRAGELRRLLRERRLPSPTAIEPDEDFKDVLHALVFLLSESAADQPDGLLEEANAIYQFIRRIAWGDDGFNEQRSLLRQCTEIGWQSTGIATSETAASVHRRSSEAARESARIILKEGLEGHSAEGTDRRLSDPDVLSAVCKLLADTVNSKPKLIAERAAALYRWLSAREEECGLFDEKYYFLGEAARISAGAFRHLGDREETETWLHRAEAGFRHTVNPGPLMAQLAYLRLSLAYDKRRYDEILELIPSLFKSFEKFGMRSELAKTRFLEAMTLKECSRKGEALEKLACLADALDPAAEPALLGQVLSQVGGLEAAEGQYEKAIGSYQKALPFLAKAGQGFAVANLRILVGETFAAQGSLSSAAEAYREGIALYGEIGMTTYAAYSRILLAETLIALSRHREAEWEILAALPTIEEQKMVPEGFAAVALLQESVRQRKTDSNALRELREHLKANG